MSLWKCKNCLKIIESETPRVTNGYCPYCKKYHILERFDPLNHPYTIILDLDGTLGQNVYSIEKSQKPILSIERPELFTDSFKENEFMNTTVFPNCIEVVKKLYPFFNIIILTGRSEKFRNITKIWLEVNEIPFHQLIMIKEDWKTYEEYLEFKSKKIVEIYPLMIIDDDIGLIKAINDYITNSNIKDKSIGFYLITENKSWDLIVINQIISYSIDYRNRISNQNEKLEDKITKIKILFNALEYNKQFIEDLNDIQFNQELLDKIQEMKSFMKQTDKITELDKGYFSEKMENIESHIRGLMKLQNIEGN